MRRREECFTILQSGHHSRANNSQAGVGFLVNRKWKDRIVRVSNNSARVAELVLCIVKRYKPKVVQVYAPTTSYSEEYINSFYNDVGETLGKPNHYMIVMGEYFNTQIEKRNNPMKTATCKFVLEMKHERGDTLVELAISRRYKIMNTMFQKKAVRLG